MNKKSFPTNLDYVICLLLITATLAVFWQVRHHDFINLDDPVYVTQNPRVQSGLNRQSVLWAFTTFHAGFWIPLTWLSFMLDFEIYGLNSGGYHLTNLLFHITNTLLLFLILRRTTGARWQSGFVAALFALHPLHVESVAWVTERKDVLSTFFWMLTMWTYSRFITHRGLKWYLLGLVAFAMGLMAKPMLVTLPFALLLLDYWPLGRIQLGQLGSDNDQVSQAAIDCREAKSQAFRLVWEKLPFFVLAAACSLTAFSSQQTAGAALSLENLSLRIRIGNACISYIRYIFKMIWPHGVSLFYPHPGLSLPVWQAVGAGLFLLLIFFFVMRFGRRHPYLPVGWLWYFVTLIPVIGLVQVGTQAMADRFTYIPLIGLFIIIAWGVPDLTAKYRYGKSALALAASLLLPTLMVCTSLQLKHWKNSITIFEHTLSVTDRNYLAHNNLGNALAELGRVDEALIHFTEAVKIRPSFSKAHNNLGNALARQGRDDEAMAHLTRALQLEPNFPSAHNNLGNLFEKQRKIEEAIFHYSRALQLKPDFAEAYFNLGNLLARQGKVEEAISNLSIALQLKPNFAEAHNSLGVVLAYKRRSNEAIAHFTEALRIKPGFVRARNNLNRALQQTGKANLISRTGGKAEN